jgi:hypothetical protein
MINLDPSQSEIVGRYPLLLRRWQAIELCRALGGSERTFRGMIRDNVLGRQALRGGVQYRYRRDDIARQLTQSTSSLSS